MTDAQFGFRKGRGTSDCLFILHGLIEILLAKGKKLFCCFIDYEKAYDYLDRAALFTKLSKLGVSSKCINVLKSMYTQMKLVVRGQNGEYFSPLCGLLQGESTSPVIFSLFVNDLESSLTHELIGTRVEDILIKLLMFADDMSILSETRDGLQAGMDNLKSYCTKWGITVSTHKTKVVVFRKGGRLGVRDHWHYGGEPIEVVSSFKYLGCCLTAGGAFTGCIQELTNSARRALFSLKTYFHKNPEISPSIQLKLFNAMIVPILGYCGEVWGLRKADPIEKFHLSFLKYVLCVKSSTPTCFVYGELGIFPLYIDRQLRVIKFWLKIISPSTASQSYMRKVYNELLYLNKEKPMLITWVYLVKNLLYRSGFGYVWENQSVSNENYFLTIFKQRLNDMCIQEWTAEVALTSDNRLFKHLKDKFCFESYLDINNRALRIAVTKIRLSSHVFMIERARWNVRKPDVSERKCITCNVIEDEYHCLLECPKFVNERRGCVPERLIKRPSMIEFIQFLNTMNLREQKMLGLLCFKVQKEYTRDLFL